MHRKQSRGTHNRKTIALTTVASMIQSSKIKEKEPIKEFKTYSPSNVKWIVQERKKERDEKVDGENQWPGKACGRGNLN